MKVTDWHERVALTVFFGMVVIGLTAFLVVHPGNDRACCIVAALCITLLILGVSLTSCLSDPEWDLLKKKYELKKLVRETSRRR